MPEPAEPTPQSLTRALAAALDGAGPAVGIGDGAEVHHVPDGTAVVIRTSGSTGIPKTVVLSAAAVRASATATAARLGAGAWILAVPVTSIAGVQVLVRAYRAERPVASISPRFGPDEFVHAVAHADGPLFTSLVPAQLSRLVGSAETDSRVRDALSRFSAILVGGQAIAPALRERAAAVGAPVVRTYGSTETCGGCVYDGVALDGIDVRIIDGEVQLAGPVLADGYLDDPDRTATSFVTAADGTRWYRTGDLGTLTNGVLSVDGRKDNVIVSGGINVSLDRVEAAVQTVPALAGAVVVGIPDRKWGEASAVVVAASAGESALLEAARAAVADQVGPVARPARLVVLGELPTLPSGKPDRATLTRLAAESVARTP